MLTTFCVALALFAPPVDRSTPEATIRSFEAALVRADIAGAAQCILGANPNLENPYMLRLAKVYRMRLTVSQVSAVVDGSRAIATVSSKWFVLDKMLHETVAEKVPMTLEGGNWMIGPVDLAKIMADLQDSSSKPAPEPEPVKFLSLMVSNPATAAAICLPMEAQMKAAATSTAALMAAKKIALACLMYASDNDDRLPKSAAMYRAAILPYLKKEDRGAFTAPGDKAGTASFSMNPSLAGVYTTSIDNPSRTILVYIGKDKKLDFRYRNRAAVALADGSARLVTPEQAAKLRWKP